MDTGFESNVSILDGIGKRRAELLAAAGICRVGDLLDYFPRTYLDLSEPVSIAFLVDGVQAVVRAEIVKPVRKVRLRKNMTLYQFAVDDGSGCLEIVLFNQEYVAAQMAVGKEFIFFGTATRKGRRFEMASPLIETVDNAGILHVYRLFGGFSQKLVRRWVEQALKISLPNIEEILPQDILERYGLMSRREAYSAVHYPQNMQTLKEAQHRFVFEELFLFSLGLHTIRANRQKKTAPALDKEIDMSDFYAAIPYSLTRAQHRVIEECIQDMKKDIPMTRMIQGDVGSGKTVVAAAVIYYTVKNSKQACLMAPTEILAVQHYEYFRDLFEKFGLSCALLTGSTKPAQRRQIMEQLQSGEMDLLIGTHALIQDFVQFRNLALTIVDEQHRFGLKQRSQLSQKGICPHMLVMSATPIPRSLALILYGEMDLSVIDELPAGRKRVSTFLVSSDYHTRMYRYLREQVAQGGQAYVVCPLVENGEDDSLKAATAYAKELTDLFLRGLDVRYLHGRMSATEKENVLHDFVDGKVKVLVCTTVIEVGVNVPNANIMIIENAERFGLSQLHQLRGRVGRGTKKSYCFLVSDTENAVTKERLSSFCATNNGFEISRKDLQMRGPGDFFGQRQSGLPLFRHADLIRDMETLNAAHEAARQVTQNPAWFAEPSLVYLKQAVLHLFDQTDLNILS